MLHLLTWILITNSWRHLRSLRRKETNDSVIFKKFQAGFSSLWLNSRRLFLCRTVNSAHAKWRKTCLRGRVHTVFENEGFTLKTHQMFSLHTTMKKVFNPTITAESFWICVNAKLWKRDIMIIVTSSFSKISASKCFLSTLKRKVGVFRFLRSRKTAFSSFFCVVWNITDNFAVSLLRI